MCANWDQHSKFKDVKKGIIYHHCNNQLKFPNRREGGTRTDEKWYNLYIPMMNNYTMRNSNDINE